MWLHQDIFAESLVTRIREIAPGYLINVGLSTPADRSLFASRIEDAFALYDGKEPTKEGQDPFEYFKEAVNQSAQMMVADVPADWRNREAEEWEEWIEESIPLFLAEHFTAEADSVI